MQNHMRPLIAGMHNLGQASKEIYTLYCACVDAGYATKQCMSGYNVVQRYTRKLLHLDILPHAVWPHGSAAAGPSCSLAAPECGPCTGCTAFRFALSGVMSNIGSSPNSRSERHLQNSICVCCSSWQKLEMQTARTGSSLTMTTCNGVIVHSQANMQAAQDVQTCRTLLHFVRRNSAKHFSHTLALKHLLKAAFCCLPSQQYGKLESSAIASSKQANLRKARELIKYEHAICCHSIRAAEQVSPLQEAVPLCS